MSENWCMPPPKFLKNQQSIYGNHESTANEFLRETAKGQQERDWSHPTLQEVQEAEGAMLKVKPMEPKTGVYKMPEKKESDIKSFESAWPEIKAGKEFRYRNRHMPEDWTSWTQFQKLQEFNIRYIEELEFQIKREPRERYMREVIGSWVECSPNTPGAFKVREVLD